MLYTIIPFELIFSVQNEQKLNYISVNINNKVILIEKGEDGNFKISRLYSTDPSDYLNSKYTPGKIINIQ
ncbi:MAG: YlzJ-like family protein [Thermoanaerobacteraceae bacterium]